VEARTLVVGGLGIALAVSGLWLAWPAPSPQLPAPAPTTTSPPARTACDWSAGQRFAFRVESRDRWSVDLAAMMGRSLPGASAGAAAQQVDVGVSYEFHARVLEVAGGQAIVGAILRDVRAGETATGRLADGPHKPMLLALDGRCSVIRFARHRDTAAEHGRLQQAAALGLSFRLPQEEQGARYEVEEKTGLGSCRVRYGLVDHPVEGALLFKRPLACGAVGRRRVQIRGGRTRVVLGPGPWFVRQDASLRFSIGASGPGAVGESTASVETITARPDALPARWERGEYRWGWLETTAGPVKNQRKWPGLAGMSTDQALAEMARLLDDEGSGPGAGWRFMAAWLRANPDGAHAVVAAIARGRIDPAHRADVFLALMNAGTPASRDALIAALHDDALTAADRARAATALSGSEAADLAAFEALRSRVGARAEDDPVDLVGNSAMLGLGILSARQRVDAPELGEAVRDELRRRLDGAHRHDALAAIGNSGDELLWPDVQAQSGDADVTVRMAAAGALRRMPPATTAAGFVGWLARRDDPAVLRRLVEGYDLSLVAAGEAAPNGVIEATAAKLHETADDRLRQALIRLLGGLAADHPTARGALVTAFRREWNPTNKQLIGVYVDADTLTKGP